jgi:hypothetical protein
VQVMSTSAQEFTDSTDAIERRFYSRVAPNAPVYLAIDDNHSLLLNVSENGLLVSTPSALQCNFVARIEIPLPGLPKPVQVNVRVVWANEARRLAGIQLLDLDEYDREQIRKWGTRESGQFLYEEPEEDHIAPSSSAGEAETPSDTFEVEQRRSAEAMEEETPSSEEMVLSGPVLPPTPRPASRVLDPTVPDVTTSPAARISLWVMGIAAIFLAAFFLLKTVSGISFAHSREIFHRSSADAGPPSETPEIPETPAQPVHASPPNLDPSYSYVAANAGPTPRTLDPAKPKQATSNQPASPDATRANENATQTINSASGVETSKAASIGNAPVHRDPAAANSAANGNLPSKPPAAPSHRTADSRIAANPAPNDVASKSAEAFADSSPYSSTTTSAATGTPSASIYAPSASAPLSNATRNATRNAERSENVPAANAPATVPARPSSAPNSSYLAPRNVSSPVIQPVIQMDTPERQTKEIHLQSGYRGAFFNLPGERVLESSSVTMRVQRSVRMPVSHSLWPFNRSKKVVIGGLMSRVDPQIASNQLRSADIVRVVATVGQDGRVENVKPIHGSANLLPNVLKAVQQWRYQPTLIDGKPVETQCDVLFQFHAPTDHRAQR